MNPRNLPDLRDQQDPRHLMMAALDGELEASEMSAFEQRIAADSELSAEWERLRNLKELTQMTAIKSPPDAQWDHYKHSVVHRIERGIGWILFSTGIMVLMGYGLWQAMSEIWADDSIPVVVKLAIYAAGVGTIVLFVSIGREKFFTFKHDPYKEVQR